MKSIRMACVFAFIMISSTIMAQQSTKPYSTGFGGRCESSHGEFLIGPTYKHYIGTVPSFELFALSDLSDGIEGYGFLQINGTLPDIPSMFRWYVGAGAHVGTWKGYDDPFVMGIDGLAGLEYSFANIPLALSVDWHPLFNIITAGDDDKKGHKKKDRFWPVKFGATARFIIR